MCGVYVFDCTTQIQMTLFTLMCLVGSAASRQTVLSYLLYYKLWIDYVNWKSQLVFIPEAQHVN